MKKLIIYFVLNFIFVVCALAENEPILSCPSTVECSVASPYYGTNECHLSNNPYQMWKEPKISVDSKPSNREVKVGRYSLKEVSLGINSYFLGETSCLYEYSGISILVHVDKEIFNQFLPVEDNKSKWEKKDRNVFRCSSNETTHCPMKEIPEIVMNLTNSINGKIPALYIPDSNSVPGEYYKGYNRLTYNKLVTTCGVTSNCMIDIGAHSPFDYNGFQHIGIVDLDISTPNVVKINNIYTDTWVYNTYFNITAPLIKKLTPFNTIYISQQVW